VIAAVRGTTKGFTTSIGRARSGADVESVKLLRDRCVEDSVGDADFASSFPDTEAAAERR
jgi:hypothetical protein